MRISPLAPLPFVLTGLAACSATTTPPTSPEAGVACSADALPACEDALLRAIALGDAVQPLANAYAAARRAKDPADPFAQAVERARSIAKTARAALAVAPGVKDDGTAPELERFVVGQLQPAGSMAPELLWLVLAEAAGLDYVAALRSDGSVVRAFGHDPLAPWMTGLAPVTVDDDRKLLERDAALERALRSLLEKAGNSDYVGAVVDQDELERLADAEPPHDAQALRAAIVQNALQLQLPKPLVSGDESPAPTPLAPRAFETPYYDLLRVRTDPKSALAYDKRRDRLQAALPHDTQPLVERTWGTIDETCAVTLPGSFERQRDLSFGYLLPSTLLPAGAREERGRLRFYDWYPRYSKLVDLVERSHAAFFMLNALVAERGSSSSIMPAGSEVHRRVNGLMLKHARALLEVAKKYPGRVSTTQLGFLGWPGAASDPEVAKVVTELARTAAQGSLTQARDPWDVLASTFMGAMMASNMPPDLREAHLTGLSGAFTTKLRDELAKQSGWPVAIAFGVDLAYRSSFGLAPNITQSVAEITRALDQAKTIELPGLAALASAFVHYGALAAQGSVGSTILEEGDAPLPARAAARAAMGRALGRLAEAATPDARALRELTELSDNAAATLTAAIADSVRKSLVPARTTSDKPGAANATCAAKASEVIDPKLTRALAKLRDQRKRVLSNKALMGGSDDWSKRARLLALLLSDAVDAVSAQQHPSHKPGPKSKASGFPSPDKTKFFVGQADADAIVAAGLSSFGASPLVSSSVVNAYGAGRGFLAEGPTYFSDAGLSRTRELLLSLGRLLQEDSATGRAGGLLASLAPALSKGLDGSAPPFVAVASDLFDKGQNNDAEMVLLAAVISTALASQPLGPGAFDLAERHKSAMAWVFDFVRYAAPRTDKLPPPRFKKGLDALLAQKCAVASSETITGVIDAVERFRAGDRDKARADLDRLLESGRDKLTVPHVSFAFKQETRTRALNLAIAIDLGAPFLGSTGDFNVGGGFQTAGDPKFVLEVGVESADSKRTVDSNARYYVNATAIAAVQHFLAGDAKKGELAAARALGTVLMPTALFNPGVSDDPIRFVEHARPAFVLLAQQAIDAGRPMLAGALLQVVRSSFDPETSTQSEIDDLLESPPRPLQGLTDLEPVVVRARKTLATLGGGLACVGPKSDKALLLRPTCETYPQALALRVADSVAALPELSAGKKGGACPTFAAVDGFLGQTQRGKYDPDKLIDAAEKLLADKKAFDATFLLTRQRDPAHCVPRVVSAMRRAFAEMEGAPAFRSDLMAAIVNCEVGAETPVLAADFALLDAEIRKLGDPSRELRGALFAAALSAKRGDASLLEAIAKQPDFVTRHRDHGGLLAFAVLFDHLASALAGKTLDLDASKKDVELLCGIADAPAGPDLCKMIKQQRQSGLSVADRKKLAEETIAKLSQ